MTWKLWLDDQLDDPETPMRHTPEGFLGAESSAAAERLLEAHGLPEFMDLDHDLGGNDTARHFLNRMVVLFPAGPVPEYRIHSQNTVAIPGIVSFLESWKRVLEMDQVKPAEASSLVFEVSPEQVQKVRDFQKVHREMHGKEQTAIGGRYTYEFTPTSLGVIVRCSCFCGDHIDVSDYADW